MHLLPEGLVYPQGVGLGAVLFDPEVSRGVYPQGVGLGLGLGAEGSADGDLGHE